MCFNIPANSMYAQQFKAGLRSKVMAILIHPHVFPMCPQCESRICTDKVSSASRLFAQISKLT